MKRVGRLAAAALAGSVASGLVVAAAPRALAASAPGIITTVAGGPGRGIATTVSQTPLSLLAGPAGAVYVGDNGVVRELSSTSSSETVLAGQGPTTPFGDGRLATETAVGDINGMALDAAGNLVIPAHQFNRLAVVAGTTGTFYGQAMTAGHTYSIRVAGTAWGLAVDSYGNVLFAEDLEHRVHVLAVRTGTFYGQAMTAGDTYTIAGNGHPGFTGDGKSARHAEIFQPHGLAIDSAGNVLIADTFNDRIRGVAAVSGTFYGQAMTAGDIYTIAGNGTRGYSGDGGPATQAGLDWPEGVAVDAAGNVLIADTFNDRIRVVAAVSGTFYGQAMTAGDIYTIAGNGTAHYSGDGGPATQATLSGPQDAVADAAGNVLIADTGNDRVRMVAATSGTFYGSAMTADDIYTIAGNGYDLFSGNGVPARNAELQDAGGLAADGSGDIVIADGSGAVWNVSPDYDRIRFLAGTSGVHFGRAMTAGDIYTIVPHATLSDPNGPAIDAAGNVLFADTFADTIQVVPTVSGTFYGQQMTADRLFTIAGMGGGGAYSGDGGPATAARLNQPLGVAVDAQGNVLINDADNARIRVIAETTGTFYGQAMTAGYIYTIAGNGTKGYSGDGGPATAAELSGNSEPAVDQAGNVVIADAGSNRVRVIAETTGTFYGQAMTAGDIYTIAGNGTAGYSGDGGPATSASLDDPYAVAVDQAGNVIIADFGNDRVRVIAAATGSFYGQAMTAGDIYAIAGNGKAGFAGNGGPGTSARVTNPAGVAVDGAGNVLIADSGNDRVREVAG